MPTSAKLCPECGHEFKGNGWEGIDSHWRAEHATLMPYETAWPLILDGSYLAMKQGIALQMRSAIKR
jgi:hypothetical protein